MLTRRVRNETMLQMGVGATLNITPPAFPLVVGRYGFADTGDKNNAGRGAYMGDGLHGDGERVGDIVLVAGQRLGAGRVVTFGDTSPFQNGAMFLSQHLVSDVIAWLLPGCRVAKTVGGGVDPDFGQEIAIIDFSFKPRLRLELFTETSLGGLANCLVRAGVAPVPALSTGDWTSQASHIFLINPTEEIGDAEAKWLLEYVATGGNLILSQGYVAPHPCRRLISPLGYSIEPIPLGGGDSERPVRHRNAWPVSYSGQADTSVLATAFGYPTIVTMRVGTGTFTIVGDGELLLDKNLEGELGGNPDNVTFVTGLVENLRSGKRYAVGSEQ